MSGDAPAAGARRGRRYGLTGGIGSGKSTVAGFLAALGAAVVDTDALARELTLPGGAAVPAIGAAFGDAMLTADGGLDRERMRALVFADPDAKRRLEALLHPLIGARALAAADAAQAGAPGRPVVFDVPLLAEGRSWRARCERIVVVDCAEATQVARVVARSRWSEDAVRRVIASQAARTARRAIADAVIVNEGLSLEALQAETSALWAVWNNPADG